MVNWQRDKDAILYHQWIKMASSQGLYLQLVETAHPVALHKGYTLKEIGKQPLIELWAPPVLAQNGTVRLERLYTVKLLKGTRVRSIAHLDYRRKRECVA